jgi:hypothetical protein
MAKQKSYSVSCKVFVRASVDIKAASLEDAVAQTKGLKITDFLEPVEGQGFDDYEDFEITGIYS